MNFRTFLINEAEDLANDDGEMTPQEAAIAAKKRAIAKARNPNAVHTKDMMDAKDREKAARTSDDSPTKQVDLQIARLEGQLAQMRKKRARMS